MARRRGNNEGSIYQRKNGLWCAQVSLEGYRLTKYARTQRECREWIKQTLSYIENGMTFASTRVTLEEYLESWLNGKELSKRPKTVRQYTQISHKYLIPGLGQVRLQDLRPEHIRSFYMAFQDKAGTRTLQLIHAVLNCAMNQAVREGLLGRNPVDAVERPTYNPGERTVLDDDGVRALLQTAAGSRYEMLYLFAIVTGMRLGELLALKWSDVNWKKGFIQVQRQLQFIKGKGPVFLPPKTKAGNRPIGLSQGVMNRLQEHRQRQEEEKATAGDAWQEHDLIFPSTSGTPQDRGNLSRIFKSTLQQAELPNIRFHDLRHTSITLLLDQGISINTVQRRAGHSKASTTTNIYGHSIRGSEERAGDFFDELVELQ